MTTESEILENETEDQPEAEETSEIADTEVSAETEDSGEDGESSETVITLAGEAPPPEEDENAAPTWVRELRKSNREKDRRIRELESRVAAPTAAPAAIVVGAEPTFEGCDYDPDKFKAETIAWSKRKADAENQERQRTETQEKAQKAWLSRISAVDSAAQKLNVRNSEDAVASFDDIFSPVQRGIVLNGPEDAKTSAALRYALGMNTKKAKELAAISDPVKFAIAIGKLEDKLSIAPKKSVPLPERPVRGSAPSSGTVDSQLKRLREEAEKTGNYTKVHQYKQQLREKK